MIGLDGSWELPTDNADGKAGLPHPFFRSRMNWPLHQWQEQGPVREVT